MPNGLTMSRGDPKQEYEQVCQNLRSYANMRFAQLTIMVALTGGLFALVLGKDPPLENTKSLLAGGMGLVVASVFYIMERSAKKYWIHFKERANCLEETLGYKQYLAWKPLAVSASRAVFGFYVLVWVFWFVALICGIRHFISTQ